MHEALGRAHVHGGFLVWVSDAEADVFSPTLFQRDIRTDDRNNIYSGF